MILPLLFVIGSTVGSSVDELEEESPREFAGDILLPSSELHRPSLSNTHRINPLLSLLRSSFNDNSFSIVNNQKNNGDEEDERYQRLYPHFHRQGHFADDQDEDNETLVDEDSAEDDPVVVRLHIEPAKQKEEEELETKIVRLFIGTRAKRIPSSIVEMH